MDQRTSFGDNNHVCEEPPRKQKVTTNMTVTDTIEWDQANDKSLTCSSTATALISLNTTWPGESAALLAHLHETNFPPKVNTIQVEQQQPLQQPQQQPQPQPPQQAGMWHFQPGRPGTNPADGLVSSNEENSKWETIDAKPMTEELLPTSALPVHPQAAAVLTTSDWSTYLGATAPDKSEKWIPDDKVSSAGWSDPATVSVLAQPMLSDSICSDASAVHQTSGDMIPVNPKDLVMTPSPMDVDTFVYRANPVPQSLQQQH